MFNLINILKWCEKNSSQSHKKSSLVSKYFKISEIYKYVFFSTKNLIKVFTFLAWLVYSSFTAKNLNIVYHNIYIWESSDNNEM